MARRCAKKRKLGPLHAHCTAYTSLSRVVDQPDTGSSRTPKRTHVLVVACLQPDAPCLPNFKDDERSLEMPR